MTVLTGFSSSAEKKEGKSGMKTIQEDSESSTGSERDSNPVAETFETDLGEMVLGITLKDTHVLVEQDVDRGEGYDEGEMPLPKMQSKSNKGAGSKKVTFNIPENENKIWRRMMLRLIMALLCGMLIVCLSKYTFEKYRMYKWQQQLNNDHVVQPMHQLRNLPDDDSRQTADDQSEDAIEVVPMSEVNLGQHEDEDLLDDRNDDGSGQGHGGGRGHGAVRLKVANWTDVWLRVGVNKWRLDSGDRHRNYSLFTDTDKNYTALKLLHVPDDRQHPHAPTPLNSEFKFPVCYVGKTHLLNLPPLSNITKLLNQINHEAAMIVTKMAESLFFDIGQPISLNISLYGSHIHKFCSGSTAYQLKPLNMIDEIRRELDGLDPKNQEDTEQAVTLVREKVSNVLRLLDDKLKKTTTATAEPKEQLASDTDNSEQTGEAEDISRTESGKPLADSEGSEAPWTLQARDMQAPHEMVESAEELQRINNELMQHLHSGDLLGSLTLMRQFQQVVAYLPRGDYSLRSPQGVAMSFHIRRQAMPLGTSGHLRSVHVSGSAVSFHHGVSGGSAGVGLFGGPNVPQPRPPLPSRDEEKNAEH